MTGDVLHKPERGESRQLTAARARGEAAQMPAAHHGQQALSSQRKLEHRVQPAA